MCICSTLGTPLGLHPGPLGFTGLPVTSGKQWSHSQEQVGVVERALVDDGKAPGPWAPGTPSHCFPHCQEPSLRVS